MRTLKQNAARNILVFMKDSADGVSGKTGLTLTITASKDGAAFASISPTVTELGNGWYLLALTASHTDTLGDLALNVTGTGANPEPVLMEVESHSLTTIGTNAFLATELAIATVTSQTVFVLTGGPTNNIANVMAIFFDADDAGTPVVAEGSYAGSTGTLTLSAATPITVTTGDTVTLVAVAAASDSVNLADGAITADKIATSALAAISAYLDLNSNLEDIPDTSEAVALLKSKFESMIEGDGGVGWQYTQIALENAPATGGDSAAAVVSAIKADAVLGTAGLVSDAKRARQFIANNRTRTVIVAGRQIRYSVKEDDGTTEAFQFDYDPSTGNITPVE